jgi:hypothetical protein
VAGPEDADTEPATGGPTRDDPPERTATEAKPAAGEAPLGATTTATEDTGAEATGMTT